MASITIIPSTQDVESIPGWKVVEVQRHQHWDDVPSELFADYTPLEIYIELSKPIRIMGNYRVDQFAAETIDQLLANYQKVLKTLVAQPETPLLEILSVNNPNCPAAPKFGEAEPHSTREN